MSDDPLMSDPAWSAAARFLEGRIAPGQRVTAPPAFARLTGPLAPPDAATLPDWAVIHKGELDAVPAPLLRQLMAQSTPVFANDVFVIFARRPTFGLTNQRGSVHVNALVERLASLGASDPRPVPPSPPAAGSPPSAAPSSPPPWASAPMAPAPPPPSPGAAPGWGGVPSAAPPAPVPGAADTPSWALPPPAGDRPAWASAPTGMPRATPASRATPAAPPVWPASPAPVATGDAGPPRPFGGMPPEAAALRGGTPSVGDERPAPTNRSAPVASGTLATRLAAMLPGPAPRHAAELGGGGLATEAFPAATVSPEGANDAVVLRVTDVGAMGPGIEAGLRRLGPSGHLLVVAENAASLGRRLARGAGRPTTGGVTLADLLAALRAAGLRPARAEGHSLDAWRAWSDEPPAHQASGDGAAALEEAGRDAGPDHAAFLLVAARSA